VNSSSSESDNEPIALTTGSDSQESFQENTPTSTPTRVPSPTETLSPTPIPTQILNSTVQSASIGGFLAAEIVPLYQLDGLGDDVTLVAFSPDSSILAAASTDGTVGIWQANEGSLISLLEGHTAQVLDLAFSPDGTQLASGGEDSVVRIWDVEQGTLIKAIDTSLIGRALAVAFSPDGSQIAVGGHKCAVGLYTTWNGLFNRSMFQPGCNLQEAGSVLHWGLTFSADGSLLTTAEGQAGASGSSIQIWQVDTYTTPQLLESFSLGVRGLASTSDGSTLAVALIGSSMVQIVESEAGEITQLLEGHLHRVNSVEFSPDGFIVASGSRDGTVKLWGTASGLLLRTLEGHTEAVNSVAFSPDGGMIASGSDDGTVIIWSLNQEG
jgi:WD40 repeat protein